jgi:hypothetical protein
VRKINLAVRGACRRVATTDRSLNQANRFNRTAPVLQLSRWELATASLCTDAVDFPMFRQKGVNSTSPIEPLTVLRRLC